MEAQHLEALFGAATNIPADSKVGEALKELVDLIRADAKISHVEGESAGPRAGSIGTAARKLFTAAGNRQDALFKKVGVLEREGVVQMANLGLMWLDN